MSNFWIISKQWNMALFTLCKVLKITLKIIFWPLKSQMKKNILTDGSIMLIKMYLSDSFFFFRCIYQHSFLNVNIDLNQYPVYMLIWTNEYLSNFTLTLQQLYMNPACVLLVALFLPCPWYLFRKDACNINNTLDMYGDPNSQERMICLGVFKSYVMSIISFCIFFFNYLCLCILVIKYRLNY